MCVEISITRGTFVSLGQNREEESSALRPWSDAGFSTVVANFNPVPAFFVGPEDGETCRWVKRLLENHRELRCVSSMTDLFDHPDYPLTNLVFVDSTAYAGGSSEPILLKLTLAVQNADIEVVPLSA